MKYFALAAFLLLGTQTLSFGAFSHTFYNTTPPLNQTATFFYTGINTGVTATGNFTASDWDTTTVAGQTTFRLAMQIINTVAAPALGDARIYSLGFTSVPVPTVIDYVSGPFPNITRPDHFPVIGGGSNNLDFCMYGGSNCTGGPGGIAPGFSATQIVDITYAGIGDFTFDGLYARFQSISGTPGSDVATGTVVPEPGFYGLVSVGLVGLYAAAVRRRRKQAA